MSRRGGRIESPAADARLPIDSPVALRISVSDRFFELDNILWPRIDHQRIQRSAAQSFGGSFARGVSRVEHGRCNQRNVLDAAGKRCSDDRQSADHFEQFGLDTTGMFLFGKSDRFVRLIGSSSHLGQYIGTGTAQGKQSQPSRKRIQQSCQSMLGF